LQADYVTVVENGPMMSAKYRLSVTFGQNWPTQQSYGLFATAKILLLVHICSFFRVLYRFSVYTQCMKCIATTQFSEVTISNRYFLLLFLLTFTTCSNIRRHIRNTRTVHLIFSNLISQRRSAASRKTVIGSS